MYLYFIYFVLSERRVEKSNCIKNSSNDKNNNMRNTSSSLNISSSNSVISNIKKCRRTNTVR